jgi:hypothetical protein
VRTLRALKLTHTCAYMSPRGRAVHPTVSPPCTSCRLRVIFERTLAPQFGLYTIGWKPPTDGPVADRK